MTKELQDKYTKIISKYCEDYGVSQQFLAKKIGYTRSVISEYLKGKKYLKDDKFLMLKEYVDSRLSI